MSFAGGSDEVVLDATVKTLELIVSDEVESPASQVAFAVGALEELLEPAPLTVIGVIASSMV